MMFDNPRLALRALKGAPLSVLLALSILQGQQTDENEIASITGYSGRTVRNALKFLKDAGLVVRSKRYTGWQMEPAVRQLPLPLKLLNDDATDTNGRIFLSPPSEKTNGALSSGRNFRSDTDSNDANGKNFRSDDEPSNANGKIFRSTDDKTTTNGNFFRSDNGKTTSLLDRNGSFSHTREHEHERVSSSTSYINTYKEKSKEEEGGGETQNGNGKIFRSEQDAVFAMLREAGVGVKMAQELVTKSWVTAEYVQAHLAKIKQDNEPLRYAIHRIREGDAAPVCECGMCEDCIEQYYKQRGLSDIIQR